MHRYCFEEENTFLISDDQWYDEIDGVEDEINEGKKEINSPPKQDSLWFTLTMKIIKKISFKN